MQCGQVYVTEMGHALVSNYYLDFGDVKELICLHTLLLVTQ